MLAGIESSTIERVRFVLRSCQGRGCYLIKTITFEPSAAEPVVERNCDAFASSLPYSRWYNSSKNCSSEVYSFR